MQEGTISNDQTRFCTADSRAQELKGIYINIVDFVDAYNNDRKPRLFRSYKALQSYILNDKTKIFPKNEAKGNPILKWMLIGVF